MCKTLAERINCTKIVIVQTDFLLCWVWSGAQMCTSCRNWKMLSNACFLANFILIQPRTSPPKISKICQFCRRGQMDEGRSPVAKVRYRSGRGVMLVFEHTQERDEMEQLLLRPTAVQQEKKIPNFGWRSFIFIFQIWPFFVLDILGTFTYFRQLSGISCNSDKILWKWPNGDISFSLEIETLNANTSAGNALRPSFRRCRR